MNYAEMDRKRPQGNYAGAHNATPAWKIRRMQQLWEAHYSADYIANQLSVARSTVHRHCRHIPREESNNLTDADPNQLLRNWHERIQTA